MAVLFGSGPVRGKENRFPQHARLLHPELKDGARPVDADPSILTSPCDAIVGAGGAIEGTNLFQVKGFPYTLRDLLGQSPVAGEHVNGCFVTLRLTSNMYHRFSCAV
jgi:phosphatidylserine decarboxylase